MYVKAYSDAGETYDLGDDFEVSAYSVENIGTVINLALSNLGFDGQGKLAFEIYFLAGRVPVFLHAEYIIGTLRGYTEVQCVREE